MGGYDVHMSINKVQHGFKKRVISQAFSDRAMKEMEDYIIKVLDNLCGKLIDRQMIEDERESTDLNTQMEKRHWSSPKDMADWSDYLAFDIMGTLCFGKSFGMLDTDTNRYILDTLREATSGLHTVCDTPKACLLTGLAHRDADSTHALATEGPGQ